MKRLLDIIVALVGLLIFLLPLLVICLFIWLQDRHSPFYIPVRVGRNEKHYRMIKLRSMVIRADKTGVDSTANSDPRITAVGRFIRRTKMDELPQLANVLKGEMSLVGPRPNVERETQLYTVEEKELLRIRPGITDIASIVFADEGHILEGKADPDLVYNQIIRPYKSRLGLLYVAHAGVSLDLKLIYLTILSAFDRESALNAISKLVRNLGAPEDLVKVSSRLESLQPAPPPGAAGVVTSRNL